MGAPFELHPNWNCGIWDSHLEPPVDYNGGSEILGPSGYSEISNPKLWANAPIWNFGILVKMAIFGWGSGITGALKRFPRKPLNLTRPGFRRRAQVGVFLEGTLTV